MTDLLYPESPLVGSPPWSPERRGEPSRRRRPSVLVALRDPAHPFISSHPTISSIRAILNDEPSEASASEENTKGKGKEDGNDVAAILRHALCWGLERSDNELVSWLCNLEGRWRGVLDKEVDQLEDHDGWGVVGMAIHGTCGHREKESVVRTVVSRWGLDAGPRRGTDKSGWTPLHLAAIISTPPLISFLLTRGASSTAETDRGFTPLDLVVGMPDRSEITLLLELPGLSSRSDTIDISSKIDPERRKALASHRERMFQEMAKHDREVRRIKEKSDRETWLRDMAQIMEVDVDMLLLEKTVGDTRSDSLEHEDDESAEEGQASLGDTFSDVLVFAPWNTPTIFDIFISSYPTRAQPAQKRGLPANAIYRYAKFAFLHWDLDSFEWLTMGAVDRIEQEVFPPDVDLARLSFWVYNGTLLLHLFQEDGALRDTCVSIGLIRTIEELLNAIHVFIIRMTERRIDSLLDSAFLEHETLEEVSDVRFEGEWNLFGRPLTLRKKRDTIPRAGSIFANGSGTPSNHGSSPSVSTIFGSVKENSPFKTPGRPQSMQDIKSKLPRAGDPDTPSTPLAGDNTIEPSRVTDILSSVLLVMQLYEINPAIIVQAFSQVFFWVSCELFNRILTRKKYLCRSKAVQICMNITVLDDWVRANGLPVSTGTRHFEPLTQLLQWLQCLSQITDFDTLIVTMQNMRSINPLQLRRAVKDYKYEVGEGRMTEECAQYLNQVQKDWEKRRAEIGRDRMRQASTSFIVPPIASSIDDLFDGSTQLSEWIPESPPECLGELLDSRFMIPFTLPSDPEHLVATPPFDMAFKMLAPNTPFITDDTSNLSRPASRASYSSSRPLAFRIPDPHTLRRLPPDFFSWLKNQEAEHRLKRDGPKPKTLVPARDPPLKLESDETPSKSVSINTSHLKRESTGQDITPTGILPSSSIGSNVGFPSPGLMTSDSIDELRVKARRQVHSADFQPVRPTAHQREESFELAVRSSPTRPSHMASVAGSAAMLAHPESPTPNRIPAASPLLDADGGSKQTWWNGRGGTESRREGSEDTVMQESKTPMGTTPGGSAGGQFWAKS